MSSNHDWFYTPEYDHLLNLADLEVRPLTQIEALSVTRSDDDDDI
jgi:hypothetical protein